ncbi:MAG: hypothetical protein ACP5JZ_01330 [Thermosulfidibacteraceae bacterium]|jgi:cell shape-determining protein MreD
MSTAKRKKIRKIEEVEYSYGYITSLFVFMVLFRIFLMVLQDIKLFKFFDIFTVTSIFISSIATTNPLFILTLSTIGGLTEDIATGSIIGLNMLTKSTLSFIMITIRRKMEIGNSILLIPITIIATTFDIVLKYLYVTMFLNYHIASHVLIAEIFLKNMANTVILIILMVITKK